MPYHIDEENSELAFEVREGNKLVIKIKSNIFSDSLELYLIKVGDNTEPTDKNVFSSLRVLKEIENLHDTILKEINSVTSGFWELKQDSQGNEYIATKYNVLTEGGLTTYGLGEQKLGTIYDGLPIDNDTIYWEEVEGSRVLKAKGSGGGSTGLDETKLWNVLGTPGDQQIDYSHLRSAFSQFSNEFVTINTEQEITALKHFTAGLSIGSAKKKIYEKDGVLYIDSNVAITGALTMYATDGQSVSSIYDGLPIDNDTIYWETVEGSRVLKAKGSGGEAGSVQWGNISGKPTWIEDTKPTYNWYEIQGEKPFYTKEEVAAKFVTINTEQDITALKHFTAGLSVGESKKKIYEENGVVYIDADVAVTGAMTFYASAGRSVSTIMDGVTVDEETITKGSDNVLRIKNAGAGSSFDENAMWSALSGSSDNQINKSHLTTALDGYATQNWVIENYATKSELSAVSNKLNDFLEGSDTDEIINKWKELEAFLSGMAETDNLAEILETKADKKYVDSTFVTLGTKQTITGEKTFSSVLNTAAIKASGAITAPSLAVSDWVTIAGIKLRKLEDGALMLEGNLALTGALTMYASNGQSFDTIYDGLPIDNDTIYWQEVDGSRVLKAREGSGSSFDKSAMWTALAGSTTEQINKSHLTTALTGYATESWVSGKNYAVKATTLAGYGITDAYTKTDADSRYVNVSGDTMTGNLSVKFSGRTDQINLFHSTTTNRGGLSLTDTDNTVHAFHLTTTNLLWKGRTVWDSGNDGSGSGLDADLLDGTHKTGLLTALSTSSATNLSITVGGTTKTITDLYAYASTKLETARTLWGRSFDGTGNVSGNLDSVGNITGSGSIDVITKNNQNIRFKINNDDTLSVLLEPKSFRPFGAASNSINLGLSDAKWKDLYLGRNAYIDGVTKTGDFYIGGIRLHKTADGVITLEGNLAVTGGITTYAIDPVSVSTVMDGVVVDGTTIKKENGKLVAVGGGEAGSVAWGNITGKPSVFATNIANITDLHSSWDAVLKAQKPNWLTAVSIATISDLHANWDALLKAAPSAYVTRWPTISEVTGKQNLIVKLNGGTTEGTNQFTYNATGAKTINITPAGIGAATSGHTHAMSAITDLHSSWDALLKAAPSSYVTRWPSFAEVTSKPSTLSGYGITDAYTKADADGRYVNTSGDTMSGQLVADGGIYLGYGKAIQSSYTHLLKTGYEDGAGDYFEIGIGGDNGVKMYLRGINNGTLVWNGNTVWNAANSNRSDANWSCYTLNASRINSSEYVNCAKVGYNTSDSKDGLPWYGMGYGNHDVMTFSGYGGVNIRTAFGNNAQFASNGLSYFHSHVLIKGSNRLSFDDYGGGWYMQDVNWVRVYGDKNIYTGGAIQCGGYVYTGTGFRINYGTNSAFINVNWDGNKGDFVTFHTPGNNNQWFVMELWSNGNVYTNGNFLAEGGSTFYGSDIRYKSIMQQVNLSLLDIAKAPSFVYRWNKKGMKRDRLNLGGSAQYTQSILPWAVEENDNFLSMDYATVAYTFAVHTARHLLTYESRTDKKIKKLENRVKYLEKQLKKLGYEEVRTLDDQSV